MYAELVYDGTTLNVPSPMGAPAPNQLQGTTLENLSELACRVCYDSLGQGRGSESLHEHILQVKHLSVYEHPVFTVVFSFLPDNDVRAFLNRKGVWVEESMAGLEVTINFRALLEWDRHTKTINRTATSDTVRKILLTYAADKAPLLFERPELYDHEEFSLRRSFEKLSSLSDDQAHISLFLSGSRGFSHEQARHRFAISQRSTRYCDEDASPYMHHPLITAFIQSDANALDRSDLMARINESIAADRLTYLRAVRYLEGWLTARGTDRLTARKQARGAARGYLGNALQTEMIFTAPVSGWHWILRNRASEAADGEIRGVYAFVLEALKASAYGTRFQEFELISSPDGIGQVLQA